VINNINILIEDIESLYDTYNAIVSMKTNLIVTVLTIFTAVIGVMTLITGFYGMNVVLPGEQVTQMYWYILGGMALLAIVMVVFFKQKKWI
jgi:magnesium transporter